MGFDDRHLYSKGTSSWNYTRVADVISILRSYCKFLKKVLYLLNKIEEKGDEGGVWVGSTL